MEKKIVSYEQLVNIVAEEMEKASLGKPFIPPVIRRAPSDLANWSYRLPYKKSAAHSALDRIQASYNLADVDATVGL